MPDLRHLLLLALTLPLASCGPRQGETWVSASIDGRRTSSFTLIRRGGEIVGGHDSCNGWGLSDQPGLITIDAQECPLDPMRDAYWVLARGSRTIHYREGAKLVARGEGHVGVFVRP